MIELPEAMNLARQIGDTIINKRITGVTAQHTPHKLAWYYGQPAKYSDLLTGKAINKVHSWGGLVEIQAGNMNMLFGDGVGLRFHSKGEPHPERHQLLIEFDNGSALSASVQMYGGVGAFIDGELDNPYYLAAKKKPSPLSAQFDEKYFNSLVSAEEAQKLSLKGLLATAQRIPGLGNGVLQDILFDAAMHPKKKVNTLSVKDKEVLFDAVKRTLSEMAMQGGRDTELDLFGYPGGYKTVLSKNTANSPCPACGTKISKEAYMGGSVYYCAKCQKI
jgi:formamidopyrimidine-DNA glycosylase